MTADDASDYEKAAALIGEAAAGGTGTAAIDIDAMLSKGMEIRAVAYSEVSALLESVEAKTAEAAAQQPQAQKAAAQRAEPQAPAVRKPSLGNEAEGAARALSGVVGGAGRELGESVKGDLAGISARKLVMPKLSVQDQLSDLESIEQGMAEGTFDKKQLGIIANEIRWLYAASMREDTKGLSDEQKELVALRNQKAIEIATAMGLTLQRG